MLNKLIRKQNTSSISHNTSTHDTGQQAGQDSAGEQIAALEQAEIVQALEALALGKYDFSLSTTGPLAEAVQNLQNKLQKEATDDLIRAVKFSSHASQDMALLARMTTDFSQLEHEAGVIDSAIEDMSASINQLAEVGQKTSGDSQIALDVASQGNQSTKTAIEAMNEIRNLINALSKRLEVLEGAAEQIGGMTQTIEEISEQTKLLALNATIEAARAGESGKGFAVVANEVKSLSEQTSKATDHIRGRVKTLNSEVLEMSQAMSQSDEVVSNGESTINDLSGQIGTIYENISHMNNQMGDMANILDQQKSSVAKIAENSHQIIGDVEVTKDTLSQTIASVNKSEALIGEQFSLLENKTIAKATLLRAKSDHMTVKRNVAAMRAGIHNADPATLRSHTACRLGKWYSAQTDLKDNPHYQAILAPHEEFHINGAKSAEAYLSGDHALAKHHYEEMERASSIVLDLLDKLYSGS